MNDGKRCNFLTQELVLGCMGEAIYSAFVKEI